MLGSARLETSTHSTPTTARIGWAIGGLVSLFLLVDGILRFLEGDAYLEGTTSLGFPADHARWIGLTLVVCTLLYVAPRTALLGAILLTGYLGGAVAAQVRAEEMGPVIFAVAMGMLAWVGVAMPNPRVGGLIRNEAVPW